MNRRLLLALLLPLLALAVQWALWPWIKPFVWFLFFPAVFFSARLAGLWGGLASSVLCAGMVWYFFIPPQLSWAVANPNNLWSVALFLAMGWLFSDAQERLRRSQAKAEAALAETRAANEKITRLYQKTLELDELKTQFFANVSHELRTPLTLIMSPLARRLALPGLDDEARREAEMMLRNARLLYRHVTDLLDAAKLESGHMALDYAHIDLGALTRLMGAHFTSLAEEKGIVFQVTAQRFMAEVDGEKVQRILLNLLSNAFKFTPDGGRIDLTLHEEGGAAVIEVADNGPGVPADLRAAVFDRFRQVEGSAQRRYGGTGLGLAIVKQFAELQGGTVAVDETPGGGARFRVSLPLTAPAGVVIHAETGHLDPVIDQQGVEELRTSAPGLPDATTGAGTALVLVVEDNPDMNAYIVDSLRPHFRVASARDGREGLEKALALHPDLILSDVMMPRMSGDEMVQEVRRHLPDVPIVMLTAKADDELRVRMLREGVQDYLNKPFVVDELLARVGGLVAARRQTLEQLQRSSHAMQEAQHLAGVGSWAWDTVTDCHVWSAEIYHIYGRDPAMPPAVYPEVRQYFTPDSWANLAAAVERGTQQGTAYACDAEVVRPDGSHRWITARGEAVRDVNGKVIRLHGTVQDITERKQVELALRESEERLQLFVQHAPASLAMFDCDMRYLAVSRRWLDDYGLGGRDLLGQCHYEVFPDIPERWKEIHRRCLAGEVIRADADRFDRADGSVMWLRWEVRPWHRVDGGIGGMVVFSEDITRYVEARDEIHRLNADLEQRVADRTAELTAANRELDSFAYAVSHDLRAPLRAMSGFSQALAEDYGEQLQGEARMFLQQIDLAGRKMGDLIDGLLALSRSTRGEMQHDDIDVSALTRAILAELVRGDPDRVVAQSVAEGLRLRGDARMIEAVLRNLLGNAWKYTAHAAAPHIRVEAEERSGKSWICVADNGAGFDMRHANRLFQPFQRLHRQDEFPGIGIGLATVQRIIHRHGGAIEARGEPDQGATFCFTLGETAA